MIDLNHILLFIACVSPLVMLAQTLRRGGLFRPWRLACVVVLLVTAGAWFVNSNTAGFVGAGAWLALLLVPAVGIRRMSELAGYQYYGSARRWARMLRLVHPSAALRDQTELFAAMERAQTGDFSALTRLDPLRNNDTNAGRQAIAQGFRLRGAWPNLVDWVRAEVPAAVRHADFALMPLYLRALGEIGARDELVLELGTMLSTKSSSQQPAWSFNTSIAIALGFCGRLETESGRRALEKLPTDVREFWIGTNELIINHSAAERRFKTLRTVTRDRLLLSEIDQRLETSAASFAAPLSPPTYALLHRIEQIQRPPPTAFGTDFRRPTVAVTIFIALNLAMFLAEMRFGGSTSPLTLHRLGALEPWAIRYGHQYWRMLTALFLHFGWLHLVFNLYALFVIGPGLERAIGSFRFGLFYLLAGLGSSAGVLLLRFNDYSRPEQLVGASGCVMGVVGVWAGYLLRHRREPFAGRRLLNIVLIVGVQVAFDLSTPQISMTAHLSGLATGVVLGLLASPVAAVYDHRSTAQDRRS